MPAFKIKLEIPQGATFSKLVTWKTGATVAAATPVDLTNCTARMQARVKITDAEPVLNLTTENGGIILGGTAGTIEFCRLSATASAALDWKSAVYDLEIIFPDGSVLRKIYGSISVSAEVTRP